MSFHPKMAYGATFHKSSRQLEDEGPVFEYTAENRARFDELIKRYPEDRRRSAVLPALYLAQHQQGYITANVIRHVAELLGILSITKQSLGRVLKQLVDEGYVEQKEGATDRRQRLLFVTTKGEALALKLAGLQSARIGRALAGLGYGDHDMARRFLIAMLDPGQRDGVLALIDGADPARRRAL